MKKNTTLRTRIFALIGVVAVVGFLFLDIFTEPDLSEPNIQTQEIDDCFTVDECNQQIELILGSVVTPTTKPTSNDSKFQKFLDDTGISQPPLVIEASIIKIDSNNNQFPTSSFFAPTTLSLVDEQGNLLDLGRVENSFTAITQGRQLVNIQATIEIFLDDDKITQRVISVSGDSDSNGKLDLWIGNSAFPSFSERSNVFAFSLADEGEDWENNSEHSYRIIITEVKGTVGSSEFDWSGEFVIYKLDMIVDTQKITVISDREISQATSVFKSDSTVSSRGTGSTTFFGQHVGSWTTQSAPSLPVKILRDNELVTEIDGDVSGGKTPAGTSASYLQKGLVDGNSYNALQRNATYTIIVNPSDGLGYNSIHKTEEFIINTPKSQHNYDVICSVDIKTYFTIGSNNYDCISNFGYESSYKFGDHGSFCIKLSTGNSQQGTKPKCIGFS